MVNVTVNVDHDDAGVKLDRILSCVHAVLSGEGRDAGEIGIVLSNRQSVHELNRVHLGHDHETDVITFDLREPAAPARAVDGEVYVDVDTARERHDEFGASYEDEICRYVIHGVLHLVGYEDDTADKKLRMRKLEDRYLDACRAG